MHYRKSFYWLGLYFSFITINGNSQLPASLDSILTTYRSKNVNFRIEDQHCDDSIDLCYYYLQQTHDQLPIHNYVGTFVYNKRTKQWVFNPNIATYKSQLGLRSIQKINDQKVIQVILDEFSLSTLSSTLVSVKSNASKRSYRSELISEEEITMDDVFVYENGALIKSIRSSIYLNDINEWWQVLINAQDGSIVQKHSWTLSCNFESICVEDIHEYTYSHNHYDISTMPSDSSYEVFGMPLNSPDDGLRTIVERPWTEASPFGWHDLDGIAGADTSITFGNNVYAYPDRNADNQPDTMDIPNGGEGLRFHFELDLSQAPEQYLDAATTNLFYWNNIVHDVMYNYGFTEPAGNFQLVNYTNTGAGADYVLAEAQDGSGLNNANFATPTDGSSPRMQMFEWSEGQSVDVIVNGKTYEASGANWGPQTANISANATQASNILGCEAIAPAIGDIVLVDRGNCKFVKKALSVQNAGGVAIVICNTNEDLITMGGDTSATINIPAVMLSNSDCDSIKVLIDQGQTTATIDIGVTLNRDSDLDNGVIIHEYGHGISNRLTGGPSQGSCLTNEEQMGEGWSDFFGLIFTMREGDSGTSPRGMANYLTYQPSSGNGIRNYPYTTNMTINPLTYDDIDQLNRPHGVGSIWATVLWDLTWLLIDEYGFDQNIHNGSNGNHIALQLVTTALKLQVCNPGFIDGRDAILEADSLLYNKANQCIIWEAFARRGMGYGADQGNADNRGDEIESFDVPPQCKSLALTLDILDPVSFDTDTIKLAYTIYNNIPNTTNDIHLWDTLGTPFDYVPSSLNQGSFIDSVLNFEVPSSDSGSVYNIVADFVKIPLGDIYLEHKESFEGGTDWQLESLNGTQPWVLSDQESIWGDSSIFIDNIGSTQTHSFYRSVYLSDKPVLSFWHQYNVEDRWDGGFVELSLDNGQTWLPLDNYFIQNGYTHQLINANTAIGNRLGFSGNSNGFVQSIIDLSSFANRQVMIRFLFGSDSSNGVDGWYIDAISLVNANIINMTAHVNALNHPTISTTEQLIILPHCNSCEPSYNCDENISDLSIFDKTVYRANNTLSTSGAIGTNSSLRLRAGNSIELLPNFEADGGSSLILHLEHCEE